MKFGSKISGFLFVAFPLLVTAPSMATESSGFWKQLRPVDGAIKANPERSEPSNALVSTTQLQSPQWMYRLDNPPGFSASSALGAQGGYSDFTGEPAQQVSVELVLGWDSEHVFRGTQQAKQNITGGVDFRFENAYFGAWTVLPTADNFGAYQNRFDLYAGYGFDVSSSVLADIGVTGYIRPDNGLLFSAEDSVEIFAGISGDGPLSPSLYAFYDFVLERTSIEASVEYLIPLGRTDFVFGGTAGYSGGTGLDYGYGQIDIELVQNFNRNTSIALGGHFVASTKDTILQGLAPTAQSSSWFGVRLRAAR